MQSLNLNKLNNSHMEVLIGYNEMSYVEFYQNLWKDLKQTREMSFGYLN